MRIIKKNGGVDYVIYQFSMGNTCEIVDIAVYSERGKGIGTELLKEVESDASRLGFKKIYAFTRNENKLAQAFYVKNEFTPVAIPGFYPDGDGVIYIKSL